MSFAVASDFGDEGRKFFVGGITINLATGHFGSIAVPNMFAAMRFDNRDAADVVAAGLTELSRVNRGGDLARAWFVFDVLRQQAAGALPHVAGRADASAAAVPPGGSVGPVVVPPERFDWGGFVERRNRAIDEGRGDE